MPETTREYMDIWDKRIQIQPDSIIAHLDWWQNPQNLLKDSPPPRIQHSSVYRRLKRRLGRSLKSRFYQRTVVRSRKIIAHKRFRTKGSVLGHKTLQASMPKSNRPGCHGQLNGSSLHQQTGRDSLSRDVCPFVENHELVSQQPGVSQQSAIPQPPCLVSRSEQLQEQGFSSEVAENCCPSKVINKIYLPSKVGPF